MNKAELVEVVAKTADISKASAEKALDGALNGIKGALKKGGSVTLVGFGTFLVKERAARTGRGLIVCLPDAAILDAAAPFDAVLRVERNTVVAE